MQSLPCFQSTATIPQSSFLISLSFDYRVATTSQWVRPLHRFPVLHLAGPTLTSLTSPQKNQEDHRSQAMNPAFFGTDSALASIANRLNLESAPDGSKLADSPTTGKPRGFPTTCFNADLPPSHSLEYTSSGSKVLPEIFIKFARHP